MTILLYILQFTFINLKYICGQVSALKVDLASRREPIVLNQVQHFIAQ